MPYYQKFVDSFPTIHDLAAASEQVVLKHWEGLGYYSRARNLHATARFISERLDGKFPENYDGLIQLKGIGPYTAAAIASMSFGEPSPVIDGNVFRFISRYFGIKEDISKGKTRKTFLKILKELIPEDQPGEFNQAMMEFGATVCKPSPDCPNCIFRMECYAARHKLQHKLPVKLSKPKVTEKFFHYFILEHDGKVLMRERKASIWRGLYEFMLIESSSDLDKGQFPLDLKRAEFIDKSEKLKHLLTHRIIWHTFYHYRINKKYFNELKNEFDLEPYSFQEVLTLPKPKSINNYLQQVGF